MGNQVQDWFSDSQLGYRDRYRNVISNSDIGSYYTSGQKPDRTIKYASGHQSRIRDINKPLWHSWERLRTKHPQFRNYDYGNGVAIERANISPVSSLDLSIKLTNQVNGYYEGVFAPTVSYKNLMNRLAQNNKLVIPTTLGNDQLGLWGYGSTAIKKSLSNVPDFSLPRFIGELREGLPKIPLSILKTEKKLRSVGGEYLNYQFGVMPTVSDLQKLFELLMHPNSKKIIQRQLDHEYRVRKVLDKGQTITNTDLSTNVGEYGTLPSSFTSNIKCTRTRTQSYRVWSSVSFRFYQVHMLQGLINDLEKQLGMGVIPTAIDFWNLIPWSWFIDWFTNLNHVITNLSYLGKDGLYLQRGYIMGHYSDVTVERQSRVFMGTPIETIGTISYERKYRVKASPFGFGLTWKEFDPFQTSILAALGISKLRF
jgi:hypothetical protein